MCMPKMSLLSLIFYSNQMDGMNHDKVSFIFLEFVYDTKHDYNCSTAMSTLKLFLVIMNKCY